MTGNLCMTKLTLEEELAELLEELADVQTRLLALLADKRQRMADRDVTIDQQQQDEEMQLLERLQSCQDRREQLLASASEEGLKVDSLGKLAKVVDAHTQQNYEPQVREASARLRLLQHESLTNWVIAQRSLLHLSQMLEIVATGGRLKPTYGKETLPVSCGTWVDREA